MAELFAHLNEHLWRDGWGLPWLLIQVAIIWWLMVDSQRRGRGWVRWIVLNYFVGPLAIVVWLIRRRRWPVSADLDRRTKLRFAAIAPAVLVVQIAVIAVPALLVYNVQVTRVDGQAMGVTLNHHDRVLVNKAVYRGRDPVHGDIIMFRYPRDPEKSFIKRVIGLGGDELRIESGTVFRNGTKLDEPYVHEANRGAADMPPRQIPQGFYFVMGDRRNNSFDSRHWGLVPREYVHGKVTRLWWPLSRARTFD